MGILNQKKKKKNYIKESQLEPLKMGLNKKKNQSHS